MKEILTSLEVSIEPVVRYFLSVRFFLSLILVVGGFVLYNRLSKAVQSSRNDNSKQKRVQLVEKLRYLLFLVLAIFVLQINGVNVSAIVSSLGIIGIVIGFALQDELKDWIMGIGISRKHFFSVGDAVLYNGIEGVVICFDLKCTVIQVVGQGDTLYICNRNISEVTKLSDRCDIDVPSPYDIPAERMRQVCQQIAEQLRGTEFVHSCVFLGTEAFDASAIRYRIRIRCVESQKNSVRRRANGIIQDVFAAEGIEIPFDQLDIHIREHRA